MRAPLKQKLGHRAQNPCLRADELCELSELSSHKLRKVLDVGTFEVSVGACVVDFGHLSNRGVETLPKCVALRFLQNTLILLLGDLKEQRVRWTWRTRSSRVARTSLSSGAR